MAGTLNNGELYRLPWTLPDNAIDWLEPTSMCNLYCDGCYRKNETNAHKPLDVVRKELDVFNRLRKTDGISIAGGDPLLCGIAPDAADALLGEAFHPWNLILPLGISFFVFQKISYLIDLRRGDRAAGLVEEDRPRARGALVEGDDMTHVNDSSRIENCGADANIARSKGDAAA